MRRWIIGTAAIIALTPIACEKIGFGGKSTTAAVTPDAKPAPVAIGSPLYATEDSPRQPRPSIPGGDAIVIRGAQLTTPSTENVPSKNNGKLWQICTEWTPGTPEKDVFVHPVDPSKKYRRLREGDVVQPGELVALLDDKVAIAKYKAALTDKVAAEDKLAASRTVAEKAHATFKIYESLKDKGASKVELFKAEQDWAASVKAEAEAKGERDKSVEAINIAKVQLEEHELRATIAGKIKAIYRKPGEAVKELEPVLQIQNLDTLRAEGMLPVQYLHYLTKLRGTMVFLEPSGQLGAKQELTGHELAITGVGVTKGKPYIVSASEDKTVRVWEQATKDQKAIFRHTVPVRALAVTGQKCDRNLALSGADDGYARIYDIDAAINGESSVLQLKGQHRGRINAVAFSPDGKNCATADDKEIFIWDVNGDRRYVINPEHRGPITQVQFTPQGTLLSTARDRTIHVFELGDKAAKLTSVLDNRGGMLDYLGVSPDGTKVIFDQERALLVRGIDDGRTDAVMNAPTDSSQFTGFAVFSPDASLVIAAGTADNPLGVWKMPAPGSTRAYQRVRLAVGQSIPTCAAFSPEGSFAVVGTADHRLLIFARPEKSDLDRQYPATIVDVGESMDSTDRKVKIWAELPNPGMPLLPGDTVDIVVPGQ